MSLAEAGSTLRELQSMCQYYVRLVIVLLAESRLTVSNRCGLTAACPALVL